MCENINFICSSYSVCKYDLLLGPVHPGCSNTYDVVSGTIRDFLLLRDQSHNPLDVININNILNYLCED